jgi:hypothetical protein
MIVSSFLSYNIIIKIKTHNVPEVYFTRQNIQIFLIKTSNIDFLLKLFKTLYGLLGIKNVFHMLCKYFTYIKHIFC